MNWAEFALIAIIVVALIVLAYLNFNNFSHFMENYFIIILVIIFVILIITLSFNNSIEISTYIKVKTPPAALIYNVPTQNDSQISNLMSFNFTGVYDNQQVAINANNSGLYTFNYDTLAETATPITNFKIPTVGGTEIFSISKMANGQLKLEINNVLDGKYLDGYVSFGLLAQGNQSIDGGFDRVH
jgi:hypothetical protein